MDSGQAEVLIAASELALDRLIKYANAGDGYGVAELIATKQVSKVSSGTECLIIDPGFMTHEIRILEGLHAGEAAFVPAEFVLAVDLEGQQANKGPATQTSTEQAAGDEAERRAVMEAEAKFRTWASSSGKHTTEAKIVSYANGVVTLQNRAGRRIKVATSNVDLLQPSAAFERGGAAVQGSLR